MDYSNPYFASATIVFLFMGLFYIIALVRDDYSIVDPGWGLGFVVVSRVTLGLSQNPGLGHFIFNLLILIWGMRLAYYLYKRNRHSGEDYRYAEMRRNWGKRHRLHAFFKVFMLQGFLMWVISLPIVFVNQDAGFVISDFVQAIGLVLWAIGFLVEAISDGQMANFKSNPANKGSVLRAGLWKYSRHPNYFGETLVWWGIFMLAFSNNLPWYFIISPLLITFLLLKVSGVSLLEKKLGQNPKYKDYQESTSAFIPLPPKNKGG